jgi:hypothetical protein
MTDDEFASSPLLFPDWLVNSLSDDFQDKVRCLKSLIEIGVHNGDSGAALCRLLEKSDIPLSPEQRRYIAGELRAFYSGVPLQRWHRQQAADLTCQLLESYKREWRRAGVKGAEEIVADDTGLTLEALQKRLYRARKRKRRKPR